MEVRSCSASVVASWACVEAAFSSRSASVRARRRSCSASARAVSASAVEPLAGLLGDPGGLGAGGGERRLGLGAGLVQQPAGLRLAAGPQLLGPRHVLVDVGLDGGAALGQLVVELAAAGDGLGVPLRLEPRLVLGLLLEQPLGLRAGLAQLALGVGAQLVGLDLGVAQQLVGLVADVVVGGPGGQVAPRLVQLGAQHLDLVAEVVGVVDGLAALGPQPFHLGIEPREVVVSPVAVVAPHSAVPSVSWRTHPPTG